MLRPIVLSLLAWLCCATASAQAPNVVVQHYRAYLAALESNDLAAAEREAAAALTASEARDGDGGRTAVLALNLAAVQLRNNSPAAALAPARRALSLAQARGEERTGVSAPLAQLILARAELASGDLGAAERLQAALEEAQQARVAAAEIHDAASQLGVWSFANGRYGEARSAWSVAAAYADGSPFGEQYARATAITAEAAALLLEDLGGRRRARLSEEAAREAYRRLVQAANALAPLAEINSDGEITYAQRSYANALAWRAVLRAKLQSDNQQIPEVQAAQGDADGLSEVDVPAVRDTRPRCWVRIVPRGDGSYLYPVEAMDRGQVAGVAVRYRISEAGHIDEAEPLAVIGGEEFGRMVERTRRWRVERRDDSPANCRMAMSVIQSIAFVLN